MAKVGRVETADDQHQDGQRWQDNLEDRNQVGKPGHQLNGPEVDQGKDQHEEDHHPHSVGRDVAIFHEMMGPVGPGPRPGTHVLNRGHRLHRDQGDQGDPVGPGGNEAQQLPMAVLGIPAHAPAFGKHRSQFNIGQGNADDDHGPENPGNDGGRTGNLCGGPGTKQPAGADQGVQRQHDSRKETYLLYF